MQQKTRLRRRIIPSVPWEGPLPWEIEALEGFDRIAFTPASRFPKDIDLKDDRYDHLGLSPLGTIAEKSRPR